VTAAVSAPQNRFLVHNATDRGEIYDLDMMRKMPGHSIPYVGNPIPVPISFGDNGRIILTAESGLVKAFALNGVPLGVLELGCSACPCPCCDLAANTGYRARTVDLCKLLVGSTYRPPLLTF
jgi:hypothetical protein